MRNNILSLFLVLLPIILFSQVAKIQSGPMVASVDMREAKLWVQTVGPASVHFIYRPVSSQSTGFKTATKLTSLEDGYTVLLTADKVEPGTEYVYEIYLNNKKITPPYPLSFTTPALWQWRTDAPDFTFATGSCAFVNEEQYDRAGKPYGGNYEIFSEIYQARPSFMLWLGDNTYFREPDWNSRSGMIRRYTHTRSLPEMQPMLANMANYAIWDDHDFGPNDSDRGFPMKNEALNVFKLFWGNPTYGFEEKNCVFTVFEWSDCQFILLDDRMFRTPDSRKTGKRQMLGDEQIDRMIDVLVTSNATFKFVVSGGQILNTSNKFEAYGMFPEEQEMFLKKIADEKIPGVVFLTGDIHSSEISKLERPGTYPLFDITCSPLTSGVHIGSKDNNPLRIEESSVKARNFGLLSISGKKNDRSLLIRFIDHSGTERYRYSIHEKDVK